MPPVRPPAPAAARACRAAALAAAMLLAAAAARAQADDPFLLDGNESVAAADGAAALTINPAALGIRYPSELALSYTDPASGGGEVRAFGTAGGLGLGLERRAGDFQRITLGAGGGDAKLRLGGSAAWLLGERDGDRTVDWRFGALSRPTPWLSWGASVAHGGQPRFEGRRLTRVWSGGVGLRPLALDRVRAFRWGPRLTLTADLSLEEGAAASRAGLRLGAQIEPVPGVALDLSVANDGTRRVGLELLAPRFGWHGHVATDRHGDRVADTHTLAWHQGEDLTALAPPRLRRIAEVGIGGDLADEHLEGFSLFGGGGGTPVAPIHRQLERALRDPLTRGVLLELRDPTGMAQLEELRPRIRRLRAAGKPVVAYLEEGGNRGALYLASACDRVVTTEEGLFVGLGLRAEIHYYRRWLESWGLHVDRASIGPYKSAYREFSVDSIPPADREAIEHELDVVQNLFVSTVSADRHMDPARLRTLLDGRAWPAEDLVKAGLVDTVGYRAEARALLGRLAGLGPDPPRVDLDDTPEAVRAWRVPTEIAVVYASGAIEGGESGSDLIEGPYMGSDTIVRQLEDAFERSDVRAVVLRVESPGGEVTASNLIEHAAERFKRKYGKPLVVSMGGVAASGGYYLSVPGDRILADRFTATGSIGVVYVKPSLEGWFAKHRVRQFAAERGDYMGGLSLGEDWDAREQASADSAIGRSYRTFLAKVAAGRKRSVAEIEPVAGGRVWFGDDARERGLVDAIGGLDDAIAEARRLAGVPQGERIAPAEYRRAPPSLLERLFTPSLAEAWEHTREHVLRAGLRYESGVEPAR